jgi:hypothetical protein
LQRTEGKCHARVTLKIQLKHYDNAFDTELILFITIDRHALQVGSIANLLLACRGLIFETVKTPSWETALGASAGSGGQFELRISRSRARKHMGTMQPGMVAVY